MLSTASSESLPACSEATVCTSQTSIRQLVGKCSGLEGVGLIAGSRGKGGGETGTGRELGEARTQGLMPPACVSVPLCWQAVFIDGIIAETLKAGHWKRGAGRCWWRGLGPTCFWELPLPRPQFLLLRPPWETSIKGASAD